MVQILLKGFLISAMCTILLGIYHVTEASQVLAQTESTPTPFLPAGTFTPAPQGPEGESIFVKVSHYWPPLGGTNCLIYVGEPPNGTCVSRVWGGTQEWEPWAEIGIACPEEWDFGTQLIIDGRLWICMDRGGNIKFEDDGIPRIDMLIPQEIYDYDTVVEAILLQSGAE